MYICHGLPLSNYNDISPIVRGTTDKRHIHKQIEEHDKNIKHMSCAGIHFLRLSCLHINNLMFCNQNSTPWIVDYVKLISKRGLGYEGYKSDAVYCLDDISVDHGNFFEFVLLLGMKEHVTDCIEKWKMVNYSGGKG